MSSALPSRNDGILTIDTSDRGLIDRLSVVKSRGLHVLLFGKRWFVLDILPYCSEVGNRCQIDLTRNGRDT